MTEIGRKIAFVCNIYDGENPTFTWLKNGKTLKPSERISIFNSDISSTLNVNNVKQSDAGNYVCVATNRISEDRTETTLIVKGLHPLYLLSNKFPRDILSITT